MLVPPVKIWRQFDLFYVREAAVYLAQGGKPATVVMQFSVIRDKFFVQVLASVQQRQQLPDYSTENLH